MAVDLALTEVAAGVFELRLPIPFEDGLVNVFLFLDGDEADEPGGDEAAESGHLLAVAVTGERAELD